MKKNLKKNKRKYKKMGKILELFLFCPPQVEILTKPLVAGQVFACWVGGVNHAHCMTNKSLRISNCCQGEVVSIMGQ